MVIIILQSSKNINSQTLINKLMNSLHHIRQTCLQFDCFYVLLILLSAMILYMVGVNLYFLIDRHSTVWMKTIYRISLYTVENIYFIWRVWEIRKVDNYWHHVFMWILISFFPIMLCDTALELFMYFKLGKDLATKSKVEDTRFPGSEQNMVGMYFELYMCSIFMSFFAQIGQIVVRCVDCRNGRGRRYMSDDELKEQIEQKLNANSLPFNPSELVDKECSICQAEMVPNETLMKLKCQHLFHRQCISQWLLRTNREYGYLKCPNCRTQLIE